MSPKFIRQSTFRPAHWVGAIAWVALGWGSLLGVAPAQEGRGSSFKELSRFGTGLQTTLTDEDDEDDFSLPSNVAPRIAAITWQEPQQTQQQSTSDRLKAIREKIKLLKKLNEQSNPEPGNASPATNAGRLPSPSPVQPAAPNEVRSKLPLPESVTDPVVEPPTRDEDLLPEIPIPQASGTPVVTEPVNSLELANSLFLIGNPSAARKHYQAILKEKIDPEDEIWLKCLIGCCYRLEGDFTKAEEVFREVTSQKRQSYPIDYSKWCLQYLDQRRQAQTQFRSIEIEINAILKTVKKNE